jgi:hypothetical protein
MEAKDSIVRYTFNGLRKTVPEALETIEEVRMSCGSERVRGFWGISGWIGVWEQGVYRGLQVS